MNTALSKHNVIPLPLLWLVCLTCECDAWNHAFHTKGRFFSASVHPNEMFHTNPPKYAHDKVDLFLVFWQYQLYFYKVLNILAFIIWIKRYVLVDVIWAGCSEDREGWEVPSFLCTDSRSDISHMLHPCAGGAEELRHKGQVSLPALATDANAKRKLLWWFLSKKKKKKEKFFCPHFCCNDLWACSDLLVVSFNIAFSLQVRIMWLWLKS